MNGLYNTEVGASAINFVCATMLLYNQHKGKILILLQNIVKCQRHKFLIFLVNFVKK